MDVVIDASMLVELVVASDAHPSRWLRVVWVPGLTPLEVTSALRKLVGLGKVDINVAQDGLDWLFSFTVKLWPVGRSEMRRIWELRNSLTAYDAAYVALTERLQAETGGETCLVTADGEPARSPAVTCPVELYVGAE